MSKPISPVFLVCLLIGGCSPGRELAAKTAVDSQFSASDAQIRPIDRSMFPADFAVSTVSYPSQEKPGTIVVNVNERKLYLIEGQGRARRYAIAVGRAGYRWNGVAQLERKSAWPSWYPTDDMAKEAPGIPRMIPGGRANPLGARALYLYANGRDTLYRIHGTSEPWTIGTQASSGCIRMFNEDVIDLFERVSVGAKVIVS